MDGLSVQQCLIRKPCLYIRYLGIQNYAVSILEILMCIYIVLAGNGTILARVTCLRCLSPTRSNGSDLIVDTLSATANEKGDIHY